ncbi:hypothetical protein T492DRAFT_839375 [Pavlovales sp. CCMP2436]|nr:hypothetical protein T492DRAFT_839375 [Pavlovales sp. CCMP2436]
MSRVLTELSEAHGKLLPEPTLARVKGWAGGSISPYAPRCGALDTHPCAFSSRFEKPLGEAAPVFAGNSEMTCNSNQAWIEGASDEVVLHMPVLQELMKKYAGADQDVGKNSGGAVSTYSLWVTHHYQPVYEPAQLSPAQLSPAQLSQGYSLGQAPDPLLKSTGIR